MTNTRKFSKTTIQQDGTKVIQRYVQEIKKDGSDSKKEARSYPGKLIVYADGGYRYFGNMGSRERVSKERLAAEGSRDLKNTCNYLRRRDNYRKANGLQSGYSSN